MEMDEARAVIATQPHAVLAGYRMISGEHPNWDDYRMAMQREDRLLLQLELASAGSGRKG